MVVGWHHRHQHVQSAGHHLRICPTVNRGPSAQGSVRLFQVLRVIVRTVKLTPRRYLRRYSVGISSTPQIQWRMGLCRERGWGSTPGRRHVTLSLQHLSDPAPGVEARVGVADRYTINKCFKNTSSHRPFQGLPWTLKPLT